MDRDNPLSHTLFEQYCLGTARIIYPVLTTVLVACMLAGQDDDLYCSGFVEVNETTWLEKHNQAYLFTVRGGEISCGSHPSFGRKIYFEPKGFTGELYIGTPLNKAAAESLKQANIISNVHYSIKQSADLSEAREMSLRVCDEQQDMLDSGSQFRKLSIENLGQAYRLTKHINHTV